MINTPERGTESRQAHRTPEGPGKIDLVFFASARRSYADFCLELQSFVQAPIPGLAGESEESKAERLRWIKSAPVCVPGRVKWWVRVYGWTAVAWGVAARVGRRARPVCLSVGALACVIFAFYWVRVDRGAVVSLIASVGSLAVIGAGATAYAADQERKAAQARARQQSAAGRSDVQVESGHR